MNLTATEQSTLAECEQVIQRGMNTFVDVGRALMRIRDGRLYRRTYSAFEDYCRERWGMSRPRAYQLIESAEVTTNLSTMVDTAPTSERQARPLTKLKPEEQPVAWEAATQKAGSEGRKVTAKDVEQAVIEMRPTAKGAGDQATEAMQFAVIAISQLERIRKDDPKREEALKRVAQWIINHKEV